MYSRPPQGWHDEPFEYCFSFAMFFGVIPIVSTTQFDFWNNPLQFDPDADFYMRAIAILIDQTPVGEELLNPYFNMRLRDGFGRSLDNGFIPMQAYATEPTDAGPFAQVAGAPIATPWLPELYCPANGAMWADFQCQNIPGIGSIPVTMASPSYSFHLYFQGVKRFQNENCEPSSAMTKKQQSSQVWFEGQASI